ncbi:hypothetical protein ACJMK2_029698 [Sinanodonta woodiana]|uniref:Uncharacterized protein n=1 Tax=Sinanodonta woodiana TaxID=1069815 RepID=A0ABD3XEV3_SINWO
MLDRRDDNAATNTSTQPRDDVTIIPQLDTTVIQQRNNTITTNQNPPPQSNHSNLAVIIFIAVTSTGNVAVLIVALIFIIREIRAVMSRLDKQVSKEAIALIPRGGDA